jgi:hypothetical protein
MENLQQWNRGDEAPQRRLNEARSDRGNDPIEVPQRARYIDPQPPDVDDQTPWPGL